MIISSSHPTHTQGPSVQGKPFLGVIDDNVHSFSTLFIPPILVSEVNTFVLSISLASPPILTTEQCQNLGNVFEAFPTLTEGQVSQLDNSVTSFE